MVGRLPSSKVSLENQIHSSFETPSRSPPPYESNGIAPLFIAETTTTTTEVVTTTQTTTHLFSLPSWRKRGIQVSGSSSQITAVPEKQANGIIPATTKSGFMVEKALPPTPSEEVERNATDAIISRYRKSQESQNDTSETQPELRTSFTPAASMPSTIALAHAALGLGLPHVMPRASMAHPSDINTIAFVPPPDLHLTAPGIRKAKSSQKLSDSSSSERPTLLNPSLSDHRRARGLSFGTTSFLNFGSSDIKGKGKEVEATRSQGSPKTVSRRTSFWSRKKTSSAGPSTVSTPVTTPTRPPLPSLPSVPPVSPFYVDVTATPILSQTPHLGAKLQHSRGLSRSLSDRALHRSPPALKVPPDVPVDTRTFRRPATADSSVRSGAVSLFISSSSVVTPRPCPQDSSPSRPPGTNPAPVASNTPTPRPRAHTNPPILQRLSLNLFSSTPTNTSSTPSYDSSPAASNSNSPRPSLNNKQSIIPRPLIHEESPEIYLGRLLSAVSKVEIAGILAASSDNFHAQALRSYLAVFDFIDDPLDVALRKLLMDVGLPRETQQIDRVIEAFAARYRQCNPSLFTSDDHPYILAFSLIMLHTDAFNKSNKRKMSKADYIKNARLPGVAPEVLDCFYDNIVFAPFIFIEDPLDVNGQRGLLSEQSSSRIFSTYSLNSVPGSVGGRGNKVDPYYLITNKLLDPLRVNITAHLPLENPYSYEGTSGLWDESQLQHAFVKASEIQVGTSNGSCNSMFGLNTTSGPSSPLTKLGATHQDYPPGPDSWTLKVAKVGLLNRKDDVLEGGRKASNRKWKSWSVVLTGSQLLLFRDPSWAVTLLNQSEASGGQVILPQTGNFCPDELLSVKDALAVFDKSYEKYDNTFRFVMADGRQLLLQTSGNQELNEWISRINYASAFKSCGVRMRPAGLSGRDVELTGVAAATSHLHDMQHQRQMNSSNIRSWDNNTPQELMGVPSGENSHPMPPPRRRANMSGGREDIDSDVPVAPEVDGADQFKATFDQVKAELAAGRWQPLNDELAPETVFESKTGEQANSRLPSRSQIIQTKIRDLEAKIAAAQSQLDSHMRLIRNIATLTPFQRATRDRLVTTIRAISKRVAHARLDITRLTCYRNVLRNDLISEERDWHQAKETALRVATETLQSRSRENGIPKMALSPHNNGRTSPPPRIAPSADRLDVHSSERRQSSTCSSFHSAIDFGPDWPTSEDQYSSTFLNASQLFDSPKISSSFPSLNASPVSPQAPSPPFIPSSSRPSFSEGASPRNSDEFKHEKYYTASETLEEQAEEWNKTRCAQRVSLVRLPSTIRMSTRFERQGLPELSVDDETT